MRLLLDTHLLLWWLLRGQRVPPEAKTLIEGTSEPVFVSRASLWEMAIKTSIGKLDVDVSRLVEATQTTGFQWLDIKNEHLLTVAKLPVYDDHRDPFDRLLVAQSQYEPLTLLTHDRVLARYGTTVRVLQLNLEE